MEDFKVQAMWQQNWYSEVGWRVCFIRHNWGVSQEEVQKKPHWGLLNKPHEELALLSVAPELPLPREPPALLAFERVVIGWVAS
jgi:hypothetical protein